MELCRRFSSVLSIAGCSTSYAAEDAWITEQKGSLGSKVFHILGSKEKKELRAYTHSLVKDINVQQDFARNSVSVKIPSIWGVNCPRIWTRHGDVPLLDVYYLFMRSTKGRLFTPSECCSSSSSASVSSVERVSASRRNRLRLNVCGIPVFADVRHLLEESRSKLSGGSGGARTLIDISSRNPGRGRGGILRNVAGTGNMQSTLSTTEAGPTALPEGATTKDAEYMRMAVELARKAVGHTSPNPMVGCVIVKDSQIIGRGFHPKAGEPHAEVFALREAGKNAQGATAYVSLEPCNHTGRTPPCSQALVRARVSRVVVGTVDPNPLVGGKGVETLRKAGIKVVVGVEQALCQATAESFFHRIVYKKPFLTLRYAMSLDGASLPSHENRTSEAGSHYSLLLQEHDAVIVTDTYVRNDNPILLSSEVGARQPIRVVIAKSLELPLDSHVFDTSGAPTLVVTEADAIVKDVQNVSKHGGESMESSLRSRGIDVVAMNGINMDAVLDVLYQRDCNAALLDSPVSDVEKYLGPLALSDQGAQKVVVVISPVLVGSKEDGAGLQLEDDILKLERVTTKVSGGDVIVEGYVSKRPFLTLLPDCKEK